MSDNYTALTTHPRVRRAQQVSYSVRMLADVAAGYDQALDRGDMVLARCMLDAFYVHIRLLAEFLLRKTDKLDFGPRDFELLWSAPVGDGADRLKQAWADASKYVVHFGRPRVPQTLDELRQFNVNGHYFRQLAGDALDCYSTFVDAVSAAAPTWDGGARIPDQASEPDLWEARVWHEVVAELRGAETHAQVELST